ncbi:MAG: hypothetical protein JNM43_23695 [Planctomycetaceae bacterium]|nr:hypothetical protein [Planctomycetaceae bacterium]
MAKKAAAKRGTGKMAVKVATKKKVAAENTVQSATERREAEAALNGLVQKFAESQTRLIAAVRKVLRKRLPTAHELVYEYRDCFVISYSPNGHGYEGLFGLRGSSEGVKLYFNRGKELPDPNKLLKGSGTMARSLDVEKASVLTKPEVVSLIDAALAMNSIPFEPTGKGSVTVRPTKASRR